MRKLIFGIACSAVIAIVVERHVDVSAAPEVQRYGSVIGLKAEKLEEYKRLHAAVWPEVLKTIKDCNIRNYSIYLHQLDDENYYLFSYFEYVGQDFKADMAKMAADPMTQKWWKETDPCQFPIKHRADGEKWATMEEVFHCS
ncbi:MAG: L-rhamnose mutarotase [Candidatus Hydrogenedentes bacterium]|nr:L-rhamnose mutarotase [Candidatus Hydrogenedentota bacterium]